MKKQTVLAFHALLLLFALIRSVHAADESFTEQFLGSPLLVLAAIIIIDIIALAYHKVRR